MQQGPISIDLSVGGAASLVIAAQGAFAAWIFSSQQTPALVSLVLALAIAYLAWRTTIEAHFTPGNPMVIIGGLVICWAIFSMIKFYDSSFHNDPIKFILIGQVPVAVVYTVGFLKFRAD